MSLIEQAAKRLEQLRQAGVELPEDDVPVRIQEKNPATPRREARGSDTTAPFSPPAPPSVPAKKSIWTLTRLQLRDFLYRKVRTHNLPANIV